MSTLTNPRGDRPPVLVDPAGTSNPDSPYLDPSMLRDTDNAGMAVQGIRRPDNGDGALAAFTEQSQDDQRWGLFIVPLTGGVPTLLRSFPEPQTFTPQVIGYLP
jgi:hypothetical protein